MTVLVHPDIAGQASSAGTNDDIHNKAPFNWRKLLEVHPAADLFPQLPEDELKQLAEDIKANGLQARIVTWWSEDQCPLLLDGRNRLDALALLGLLYQTPDRHLGLKRWTGEKWSDLSGDRIDSQNVRGDPYQIALSFNVHRRHLTNEQKRELIAKLMKAKPEQSNRSIAKETKTDHKTVATVREKQIATGEIPQLTATVGVDGRARPVTGRMKPDGAETSNTASRPPESKQAEKRLRRESRERELAAATAAASQKLGEKLYGCIYADPPWQFEPYSRETGMDRAADNHYPTMPTAAIKALQLPAAANCVLFLWATVPMLPQALEVMAAWNFTYKSAIAWVKDKAGTGYWVCGQCELLLIGTRGTVPAPTPGEQPPQIIEAARGRHSEKPDVFAEHIERLFPNVPKLEMFARGARRGWDVWGNEAPPPFAETTEQAAAIVGDGLDIPDFLHRDKWPKPEAAS